MKTLDDAIQRYLDKGGTQKGLAIEIGVSPSYITKIRRGFVPSMEVVQDILEACRED